jgi:hypothetical protein
MLGGFLFICGFIPIFVKLKILKMELENFINDHKSNIIEYLFNGLTMMGQNNNNYITVWKEYEDQGCQLFLEYLKNNIEFSFIKAKSKSVYPEVIITLDGKNYAFDVKVSVDSQDPQYIARLDTFEERMGKYTEEYEIVIKYNINHGVVSIYVEKVKDVIGFHRKSKGVKYRPYDGKIRPKTWDDFENNKTYFNTNEELLLGIKMSKIHRNKTLFETWKKEFSNEEMKKIIE